MRRCVRARLLAERRHDDGGFTHKCGALYKAKTCKKHDRKLSWNKQGPPGAAGAAGATGPAGPTGAQGSAGPPVGNQYTLKLVGTASDGSRSGAPLLWRPAMSFFTLG